MGRLIRLGMRGSEYSLCIFFVAEAASSASVFFAAEAASSGSVCPPRPKPLPLSELSPSLVEAGEAWAQELKSAADQAGIPSFQWQANYRDLIISSGASGLASISPQVEATPETLYRIGSVSKLYSTVILYKLAEQGKIGLDDKLVTYLPDFSVFDPFDMSFGKDITLRHLANHLSGMGRSSPPGITDIASAVEVLKRTAGLIHPVNHHFFVEYMFQYPVSN